MKSDQFKLWITCLSFISLLSSCNGGVNLTIPSTQVESSPIVVEDPTPTPSPTATPDPSSTPGPTPSPSPVPAKKSRIFVLNATLKAINTESAGFFNYACYREARRSKIAGKFVALVATSEAEFAKKYQVGGYIYQKHLGIEYLVANSIQDLFAGKNDSIYALSNQAAINRSQKNYVWTGQRDMAQPAQPNENCNDWTTNSGEAIVGLAGATGSDALASKMQSCDIFSRLYCIEIQN